jgi:hypothetical protein
MSKPSYFLWHPSIRQQGDVVGVVLTRGERTRGPEGGRQFFEGLLRRCGISAELTAWGIHEFVTSYFGRHGAGTSELERWEECWEVLLLVDGKVDPSAVRDLVAEPLELQPETENEAHRTLPVRVIADFSTREALTACTARLRDHAQSSNTWRSKVYERYQERALTPNLRQLWVDLTSTERPQIGPILDQARLVVEICQSMMGSVSAPWPTPRT